MASIIEVSFKFQQLMNVTGCNFARFKADAMVWDLRRSLSGIRGIPQERLVLTFAGQQLEDGRTLSSYNIVDSSVVGFSDLVTINVKLQQFGGDELVRDVEVSPMMGLGELRNIAGQLISVTGIGILDVAMVVGEERVTDMMETLVDCSILDGTTVTILQGGRR